MPVVSTRAGRGRRLADRVLPVLLAPDEWPADRLAAARILDRAQSTSLTGLPAHAAIFRAARRALDPAPGVRVLEILGQTASATETIDALRWAPGLEPLPRGPRRFVSVHPRAFRHQTRGSRGAGDSRPTAPASAKSRGARQPRAAVRQGRLGDCWLVAVMAACELTRPGHLRSLMRTVRHPGSEPSGREAESLLTVALFAPAAAAPLVRRIPFLPVVGRRILISARVPARHRAGDAGLRPSAASLIEKAASVVWARGSYLRLQHDFAGIGFLLLTGRWCPARPVPRTMSKVAEWLGSGRPVVLSTLKRPGGSFTLPREDGKERKPAFMDAHVYVAVRVLRCDEDGRPGADHPLRLHVRNPVGGAEGRAHRLTNLYLSSAQLRRAFISANVGPPMT
ncbi:hypothetical protein [Brevibacterium yomogidense]|uniref:hypothetical protein n=1 Tax=Brevibacterium yomogidense TaxID=946573 RepID=UPI0018DF4D97|nr:hypothetical protein [Brevibacterium yomogidense]